MGWFGGRNDSVETIEDAQKIVTRTSSDLAKKKDTVKSLYARCRQITPSLDASPSQAEDRQGFTSAAARVARARDRRAEELPGSVKGHARKHRRGDRGEEYAAREPRRRESHGKRRVSAAQDAARRTEAGAVGGGQEVGSLRLCIPLPTFFPVLEAAPPCQKSY